MHEQLGVNGPADVRHHRDVELGQGALCEHDRVETGEYQRDGRDFAVGDALAENARRPEDEHEDEEDPHGAAERTDPRPARQPAARQRPPPPCPRAPGRCGPCCRPARLGR